MYARLRSICCLFFQGSTCNKEGRTCIERETRLRFLREFGTLRRDVWFAYNVVEGVRGMKPRALIVLFMWVKGRRLEVETKVIAGGDD